MSRKGLDHLRKEGGESIKDIVLRRGAGKLFLGGQLASEKAEQREKSKTTREE